MEHHREKPRLPDRTVDRNMDIRDAEDEDSEERKRSE